MLVERGRCTKTAARTLGARLFAQGFLASPRKKEYPARPNGSMPMCTRAGHWAVQENFSRGPARKPCAKGLAPRGSRLGFRAVPSCRSFAQDPCAEPSRKANAQGRRASSHYRSLHEGPARKCCIRWHNKIGWNTPRLNLPGCRKRRLNLPVLPDGGSIWPGLNKRRLNLRNRG